MFQKIKRKIVLLILLVMVFLLAGTLAIIYGISYADVYQDNQEMLQIYIQAYQENGNPSDRQEEKPPADEPPGKEEQKYRLSTFYSVAFYEDGTVSIDNSSNEIYSNDSLTQIAQDIIKIEKKKGSHGSLLYRVSENDAYTLVVLMDNTLVGESITTLFRYTLFFGCAAILVICVIAYFLANRMVKPIEESYKREEQFISDAGHELKTPVAAIGLNLEMLSREIGQNRWISNLQYENERMTAVIRQLLDLARLEKQAIKRERVDFSRLVMGEALAFEIMGFEKRVSIETAGVREGIYVEGEEEKLRQLLSILLDNAISHAKEDSAVEISLTAKQKKAVLSVSNEGAEIPKEQRGQIFERFYQTDSARSSENHYGLGLAIAKAVADAHRGTISVGCERGRVIFTVVL